MQKINLAEKLELFEDLWSPKIIGEIDDYDVKIVKVKGDFVWHKHEHEDELFYVIEGSFRMDFRDKNITLHAGEMIIVPKNVEHKPFAEEECRIILLERRGLINTGNAQSEKTVTQAQKICWE